MTRIASAARNGIVRGTILGARSDALITCTLLHVTTLAVRGACANFRCLLPESVAVGPLGWLSLELQEVLVG